MFDVINVLFILIFIFISYSLRWIPLWLFLFLSLTTFAPFILNGLVFPTSYMGDQFHYFEVIKSLRDFSMNYGARPSSVEVASWIMAFFPLPFVETVHSVGLLNRLIITIFVIWLYAKKNLRGLPIIFIVIFPSCILYTSLALRDTIVFLFMTLAIISIIDKKLLMGLLLMIPLYFIKFQNFYLLVLFCIIYLSTTKGNWLYKVRFVSIPATITIISASLSYWVDSIEYFRYAMFVDDGGELHLYVPIYSISDVFWKGVSAGPYFLLKPFLWEVQGVFQGVQSIENMGLMLFLIYMLRKCWLVDKIICLKWFLFLFGSLCLYGLVVSNFGTAARYKFPIVTAFVVGLAYDLFKAHGHQMLIKIRFSFVTNAVKKTAYYG